MTGETITISQGDALLLSFPITGDVEAGTFTFEVRQPGATTDPLIEGAPSGSHSDGVTTLALTVDAADTVIPVGEYGWSLRREDSGNEQTYLTGRFVVEWTAALP